MSTTAAIVTAVAVAVVLGALAFVTLARRSDVRGAGASAFLALGFIAIERLGFMVAGT